MSQKHLYICDMCEATCTVDTGEGGGWDIPEGWVSLSSDDGTIVDLCPVCWKKLREAKGGGS